MGEVERLISELKDPDILARKEAVEKLVEIGAAAVPALINALEDEDNVLRRNAIEALGRIGDASTAYALIEMLKDGHRYVREKAAEALFRIGKPAVPALIEALKRENEDIFVRRKAAGLLAEIKEPSAAPALIKALEDVDWIVRKNAVWALGNIGGQSFLETINELYMRGKLSFEIAEAFYRGLNKKLSKEKFDKGCVAPARKKPDDLKRIWIAKPRPETGNRKPETLKRCVAGG